jgi:hypothetical protein
MTAPMKPITPEQALESILPDIKRVLEIIDSLLAGGVTIEQADSLRPEIASIQARAVLAYIASS